MTLRPDDKEVGVLASGLQIVPSVVRRFFNESQRLRCDWDRESFEPAFKVPSLRRARLRADGTPSEIQNPTQLVEQIQNPTQIVEQIKNSTQLV